MTMKNPPHPGRIIRQECIEPLGLTITDAAARLGVKRQTLNNLVNGRAGISPEMSIRLRPSAAADSGQRRRILRRTAARAMRIDNMKTIAITIDEHTLRTVDQLVGASPVLRNRSVVVRVALREFAERERRRLVEERERAVLRKQRGRLARQARALVAEQARL